MKFKRVEKDILHGCYTRREARPKWYPASRPAAGPRGQTQAHPTCLHGKAKTQNSDSSHKFVFVFVYEKEQLYAAMRIVQYVCGFV
mgnify:CR=1 FL=1